MNKIPGIVASMAATVLLVAGCGKEANDDKADNDLLHKVVRTCHCESHREDADDDRHHEGAVTMVEELLEQPGSAYDPVLFEFTSDVTNDQEAEIERMRAGTART